MFEYLNTAVIILDHSLLIEDINPAAENLLGISRHRALEQPLLQLLGDDAEFLDILNRTLETGVTYANDMRLGRTEVHAEERMIDYRITIRRDYDPGLPQILLDRDQMVQAILNLVQNASTALDGHGEILLRTRAIMNFTIGDVRHPAVASIEIEDDGPGIPPQLQDSIFFPLVTSRPEGTGLGLPAAQDLISRHGGLIEFESRPGRTVFLIRIPLIEPKTGRNG